jgi:hypothetical protein
MEARQMESLLRNLDRRTERIEQILPTLATKEELRAAIAPLATKEELRAAITPLATKGELRAAVAPLATKAELHEEGERTRRHFDVVAESLRDDIRIIAEGQIGLGRRVVDLRLELKQNIAGLDKRVTRLEASKKRRRDVQ